MNQCLVTKLKAVVDNDNLPVLKTDISDFTKAAIIASGNSSMDDAQKWALDSYFESIGAIDNGTIWQKIKAIYIPLILTDRTKIFINYKDTSAEAGKHANQQLLNGGAYGLNAYTVDPTSQGITMNGADCSFYISMPTSLNSRDTFTGMGEIFKCVYDSTKIAALTFTNGSAQNRIQIGISENGYSEGCGFRKEDVDSEFDGGSELMVTRLGTDLPDYVYRLYFRDSNNVNKETGFRTYRVANRPATDQDYSTDIGVRLQTNVYYNIIILGRAFTESEAETIIEAGIDLKKEFLNVNDGN